MVDKAWKRCERRVAKYIGGERVPITGRTRGSSPDILHNWLSVEVKYRARLPAWIHDAMDQAIKAMARRQLPCVVLCEKGAPVGDSLVVMRLEDFKERWL